MNGRVHFMKSYVEMRHLNSKSGSKMLERARKLDQVLIQNLKMRRLNSHWTIPHFQRYHCIVEN